MIQPGDILSYDAGAQSESPSLSPTSLRVRSDAV